MRGKILKKKEKKSFDGHFLFTFFDKRVRVYTIPARLPRTKLLQKGIL